MIWVKASQRNGSGGFKAWVYPVAPRCTHHLYPSDPLQERSSTHLTQVLKHSPYRGAQARAYLVSTHPHCIWDKRRHHDANGRKTPPVGTPDRGEATAVFFMAMRQMKIG